MSVDGYTKLEKAERRFAENEPPIPSATRRSDIRRFKSMTEDELLDELKIAANATDAQLIMAELLKPRWGLVAGYWAVIIGMGVMIVVVLVYESYWL